MKVVSRKKFFDDRIDLTSAHYVDCIFDGCILVAHETDHPGRLEYCSFRDCVFLGDGWPDGFKDAGPAPPGLT